MIQKKQTNVVAKPNVNKATPTYGWAHVTKAKPITALAGKMFPIILNSFLTAVFERVFVEMSLSPTTLDIIVKNQKHMYGKADSPPFFFFKVQIYFNDYRSKHYIGDLVYK